jgi:uncharacterized protein YbbK (DUF523 family)
MRLMISACLLGENCKYSGGSNLHAKVRALTEDPQNEILPVCPEVMGGLSTPRPPAEVQSDGRVITKEGQDVTEAYRKGAEKVLELAESFHPDKIILQSRSPSCGVLERYDGSFRRHLVKGQGITAQVLQNAGFTVIDVSML